MATGVWFIAQDGSLSSTGSLWEVATDVTELRDKLRHALPDTALSAPTSEHPPLGLPLGLLALGAVAAAHHLGAASWDRAVALLGPGAWKWLHHGAHVSFISLSCTPRTSSSSTSPRRSTGSRRRRTGSAGRCSDWVPVCCSSNGPPSQLPCAVGDGHPVTFSAMDVWPSSPLTPWHPAAREPARRRAAPGSAQ